MSWKTTLPYIRSTRENQAAKAGAPMTAIENGASEGMEHKRGGKIFLWSTLWSDDYGIENF
jgi:hypothetical protein